MERIKEIFEELNFPGAERLKKALKNRGIPFTKEQVDKLVRGETVKQLQQAPKPLRGKVAAPFQNSEWQADLIDWTTAPSSIGEDVAVETKNRRRTKKEPEKKSLAIKRNIYWWCRMCFPENFTLGPLLPSSPQRFSEPSSKL